MTLREATRQYGKEPIEAERFAYREQAPWGDKSRLPAAREELQRRIGELDEAARVCDELLVVLHELEGLADEPGQFNRRLTRVDELRSKVSRETRAYQIVSAATQLAEFRRFSADRRITAATLDDAERARQQIARDVEFITAVRDGVVEVRPMLVEALQRMGDS
jgi:hypothetical protein